MRRALLAAVALVALVGLAACRAPQRPVEVGRPAPALQADAIVEGQRVELASFRGRPVLVNFWGSWCDPCRRELPRLVAASGRGTAVLGVAVKDSRRRARDLLGEVGATWPSADDPDEAIARRWGLRDAYPVTFAVDAAGVVRARHIGEASDADVAELEAAARGD